MLDINSLPSSQPQSGSPLHTRMAQPNPPADASPAMTPTPPVSHSPPRSLVAAAALNAGIHNEESRHTSRSSPMRREVERARRRSSIRMNLNLNDPALPAPGELQMSPSTRTRVPFPGMPSSPHHERTPSLGELHQELESEQEGQVNRLLSMIRQEHHARSNQPNNHGRTPSHHSSSAVIDDGPPRAGRSPSLPRNGHHSQQDMPHPHIHTRSRSPLLAYGSLSRQSSIRDQSQTSSHTGSPALRPTSAALSSHNESNEFLIGSPASTRDESAFYQAETQMLTRENQMLKLRIRELERQMSDLDPTSPITHMPTTHSNLAWSPPVRPAGAPEPRTVVEDVKMEG